MRWSGSFRQFEGQTKIVPDWFRCPLDLVILGAARSLVNDPDLVVAVPVPPNAGAGGAVWTRAFGAAPSSACRRLGAPLSPHPPAANSAAGRSPKYTSAGVRPPKASFVGRLKQAILDAVPSNVGAIAGDLPFVALEEIERYAESRPRAARYLASIRSQQLEGMDRHALVELCRRTGVGVQDVNGQVAVEPGCEMGFLEVLDRRRYEVELVPEQPERFRARAGRASTVRALQVR